MFQREQTLCSGLESFILFPEDLSQQAVRYVLKGMTTVKTLLHKCEAQRTVYKQNSQLVDLAIQNAILSLHHL